MTANTNTDLRNGVNGDVGCKYPCDCATTANIELEGTQTIDGFSAAENTIVLVKDQDDETENGVYVVSTGIWQRGVWFNNQLNAAPGSLIVVNGGSTNAKTIWETVCADAEIDFGTSEITFELKVKGTNTGDKSVSLTGPITGTSTESSPGVLTIATAITDDSITTSKILNNNVTNAKAAQMAAHTFKGNNTSSTANQADLTATQLTAELNNFVGDSGSGGTKGLVPAPAAGDGAAGKLLKADGTWGSPTAVPNASETVAGITEYSTQAETDGNTNDVTAVTPLKLATHLNYYMVVQDQKANNTAGGAASSGVNTRVLNTIVTNTITGASLASNQITLPAGTYNITGFASAYAVGVHKAYLYNVTDSAIAIIGASCANVGGVAITGFSNIVGRLDLATPKVFELRHYIQAGGADGFGIATNAGMNELYSSISIQKTK
jgi:hypothetical protein